MKTLVMEGRQVTAEGRNVGQDMWRGLLDTKGEALLGEAQPPRGKMANQMQVEEIECQRMVAGST